MNIKFALSIYFTFILFTVVGTLTHEFGHFIVGRYLGYNSSIHYGSTSWGQSDLHDKINSIYKQNEDLIDSKKDFPQRKEFEILTKKAENDKFWKILGGPSQTMITGSIGLVLIILIRRKYTYASKLSHWFCLFLVLFWLRQTTNLVMWVFDKYLKGKSSMKGDEVRLAKYLELPIGSIALTTGVIGAIICGYAILKFVPKDKLQTFLISGFLGGISGYVLWFKILGPVILP